jgi:hypothetical protein
MVPAIDAGFYRITLEDNGFHDPADTSYQAGRDGIDQYRNFFVFDIPDVPIDAAQLLVLNPPGGYASVDASETYAVFDVSTPVADLVAGGNNRNTIFVDLGSGLLFGSTVISEQDNGQTVAITLTPDAVAGLNDARGQLFAIGGALTSIEESGRQYVFLTSQLDANVILSLAEPLPVPEPPGAALLAAALTVLIGLHWRVAGRAGEAPTHS